MEKPDAHHSTTHLPDDLEPPPIDPLRDALFLDLDGTLAEIAPTPEQVTISPAMRDALAAAAGRLERRMAVVSGRNLDDVDRLVGLPTICLAGVHGLERRLASGELARAIPSSGLVQARAKLAALAKRQPRLLIEDKGLGIAVHYRLAPDLALAAERGAREVAEAHGLVVQPGKMVVEVREHGADKGVAVHDFMALPPFRGTRPIFVGDDHTDEAGFAVAQALGGYGVLVGEARETAAIYRLPDVAAVQLWIEAIGTRS